MELSRFPLITDPKYPIILGPNITGGAGYFNSLTSYIWQGALYEKSTKYTNDSDNGGTTAREIGLDASMSNEKYGLSDTIQPASSYALMIIKV